MVVILLKHLWGLQMNIAMWSGPRNLSTAMMYAFAARGDCSVWDEPFYASYLEATGLDHPLRDSILASYERNPDAVGQQCRANSPDGKEHYYQKHMAHHMLSEFPIDWAAECTNVFLIRHPARVIASYAAKRELPQESDLGYRRQAELYDQIAKVTGKASVVIDASDIRQNPARMLNALCADIGITFTERMLRWPAGGHPSDGPWAPHWYGAVHQSTGFAGPEGPLPEVAASLGPVFSEAMPHYEQLASVKLSA